MASWRVICFCLLAAPAMAIELANPGFEGPAVEGIVSGWRLFPIRANVRGRCQPSTEGRSGVQAQALRIDEIMGAWLQVSTPLPGGLVAGHDYEARVWLKADRALDETALVVHDNTAWFPVEHAAAAGRADREWREVVLRFRAARTDPQALLGVRLNDEGELLVDDASFRELGPADRPPATAGNVVPNGSFEAGLAGWLGHWQQPLLEGGAAHGEWCLKIPAGAPGRELQSVGWEPAWGRVYTLSLQLRSSRPTTSILALRQYNSVMASRSIETTTEWRRYELALDLPPTPDGRIHLSLRPGPAEVWVDAVQLRADEAREFTPAAPLEFGLALAEPSRVTELGEAITGRLTVANHGDRETPLQLILRVVDLWEREALLRPLALTASPGAVVLPLDLTPAGLTGAFRAEVLATTGTLVAEEVLTVLPPPVTGRETANLGTHLDYTTSALLPRCGATWTKTWQFGWAAVEPEAGVWRFERDALIDRWLAAGVRPMMVLSEAPERLQQRPVGAVGWGWYPARDLPAMTEYARQVAARYAGRVDCFELQNEPDHALHQPAGEPRAKWYAREALALAQGVRQAQPDATIVLGGGVTSNVDPERWLTDVLAAEPRLRDVCNAFSYHNYHAGPAATRRRVARLQETMRQLEWIRPLVDSEWSPVASTEPFYRLQRAHHRPGMVSARRSAAQVVAGFVARLGEGVAISFLYHGYGPGNMARHDFDVNYELGGAPRPAVAAQAVLANLLADTQPLGAIDIPGCWAYRFARANGGEVTVVWTREQTPGPISLALPAGVEVIDLMGNRQPAAVVGPDPLYLVRRR